MASNQIALDMVSRPAVWAGATGACALTKPDCPVDVLRQALAREEVLLRQKDELIQQLELLGRESDHRLLNSIQMVVSLLSMQGRTSKTPEAAIELAAAANRIATIQRVHKRIHSLDGTSTVAFKQYLQKFCEEFSAMLAPENGRARSIIVNGVDFSLSAALSTPLGFIANELITNAAKYGRGDIMVSLIALPEGGHVLSVKNDGPPLPHDFDPAVSHGLGMKIINSFVKRIGGALRFGPSPDGSTEFSVSFPQK